ncbi:hypothetical protein [Flavivirga jejuensis]|uniref:DUF4304 domain-containing protein n=1 Tax=Flavivirga jejuensis TaxID=870487 RepID=A0ABT8WNW4_9FLAO|nr:hypothetical protein [Flavivirga jejuensis]MDO5974855.1 hypothetical protein [Flavivirga jejuensis]
MLKKTDLRKYLLQEVNTFLKPKGFKKKKEDFLICSDIGVNQFGIVISYYGTAGSWLNFSATIGSDAVNKVSKEFDEKTNKFSSDDYSPLITTLTDLKEIPHPYNDEVMTLDDAGQVLQNFYLDYEKYIGPFFEQYNNLEAIVGSKLIGEIFEKWGEELYVPDISGVEVMFKTSKVKKLRRADGHVNGTIIEMKPVTGKPTPEHKEQMRDYADVIENKAKGKLARSEEEVGPFSKISYYFSNTEAADAWRSDLEKYLVKR